MKQLIFLLLLIFAAITWADENDKHPWYINITGNSAFSNFQLE